MSTIIVHTLKLFYGVKMRKDKLLYIVMHNVRSCYNVGAIFRTADGAGVAKIYLCGITPVPSGQKQEAKSKDQGAAEKIAKTALGAEKYVPWEYHRIIGPLINRLKKEHFKIIALEQHRQSLNLFKFRPAKTDSKIALIIGNEVTGIKTATLKKADLILEIPMRGQKESLNVSVAAGIAIYAILTDKG